MGDTRNALQQRVGMGCPKTNIQEKQERMVRMRITLEIKGLEDRRTVAGILVANGYQVYTDKIKVKSSYVPVLIAERAGEQHA